VLSTTKAYAGGVTATIGSFLVRKTRDLPLLAQVTRLPQSLVYKAGCSLRGLAFGPRFSAQLETSVLGLRTAGLLVR